MFRFERLSGWAPARAGYASLLNRELALRRRTLRPFLENFIMRSHNDRIRLSVKSAFPYLSKCEHQYILDFSKYQWESPERFYSRTAYEVYLSWLEDSHSSSTGFLAEYLKENLFQLDNAIMHLTEINHLSYHDALVVSNEYERIQFIDRHIHPDYLRLIEAVLKPLCRLPAFQSRIGRGKRTDDLDEIWPIIQELSRTSLSEFTDCYNHTIRNGIAHGGIVYRSREILYRDKKGNEELLRDRDAFSRFDKLLDICNGFVFALSAFLVSHRLDGYVIPPYLLVNELIAETATPWWRIIGCIQTSISNTTQLIVYARICSSNAILNRLSPFQTGVLAEFFAPGFRKYLVQFRGNSEDIGWITFDGGKLKRLRETKSIHLPDYRDAIDTGPYHSRNRRKLPKIFTMIVGFVAGIKVNAPWVFNDVRLAMNRPNMVVRVTKLFRSKGWSILRSHIYADFTNCSDIVGTVRRLKRTMIRKAKFKAILNSGIFMLSNNLPIGFAHVSLYSRDYRRRKLRNYGLGEYLVCTIELNRRKKTKQLDISGAIVEQVGKYRIAWNRSWLKANQEANNKIQQSCVSE